MVQDKIEKTRVTSMEELLTELRKLESLVQKKKTIFHANASKNGDKLITRVNQETANQIQSPNISTEKKPCVFCDKKGFPGRFHPEAVCRLKQKEQSEQQKNIKTVNKAAVQDALNETITNQKN